MNYSHVLATLVARPWRCRSATPVPTRATTQAAVAAGASWVTHLFNAMPRAAPPGPPRSASRSPDDRLRVGQIADGIHVDPQVVSAVQRVLGDRLTLVTDAVAALGMADGTHRLDRRRSSSPTARSASATARWPAAAPSMDQAVRNLAAFTGCALEEAIDAASSVPAEVLGDHFRGRLVPGARLDLVLLDEDIEVVATVVGGQVVDARPDAPTFA